MIWTNWDPLEEVIVGNCHTNIPDEWNIDSDVRTTFNQILVETKLFMDKQSANVVRFLVDSAYTRGYQTGLNTKDNCELVESK